MYYLLPCLQGTPSTAEQREVEDGFDDVDETDDELITVVESDTRNNDNNCDVDYIGMQRYKELQYHAGMWSTTVIESINVYYDAIVHVCYYY